MSSRHSDADAEVKDYASISERHAPSADYAMIVVPLLHGRRH